MPTWYTECKYKPSLTESEIDYLYEKYERYWRRKDIADENNIS